MTFAYKSVQEFTIIITLIKNVMSKIMRRSCRVSFTYDKIVNIWNSLSAYFKILFNKMATQGELFLEFVGHFSPTKVRKS